MKKLYEIDLNKVRELTIGNASVSPVIDKLLSIKEDYKPFRYSELRLSTEGILYYPTHTGSERVRIGSYLYHQKDMVCVLETSNVLSESLVIADFSTIEGLDNEDKKFHFNRVLNMYRAMREPISELSLLLGDYVEKFASRYSGVVDGRDINVWILQLQQFCRDIDFIYQDHELVPLLDIIGGILNRVSSSPLEMRNVPAKDSYVRYEINPRRFPEKSKEYILKFQEDILSDLYISKLRGDDLLLDIVATVQALSTCPALVSQCVECKEDLPDTIHFHRNSKLCTKISELINKEITDVRYPKLLEVLLNDNKAKCISFVKENGLIPAIKEYTLLHTASWIEFEHNSTRLVDEVFRTGEGRFEYLTRDEGGSSVYHVSLDTLGVVQGQIDSTVDYLQNLVGKNMKEDFQQVATLVSNEDESDLNLICPVWRYKTPYSSDFPRFASFSNLMESKCTEYKLGTESVKSFFKSIEKRWKKC